ncbi:MAG: aminotransferase [Acidobacteriota bacterium]
MTLNSSATTRSLHDVDRASSLHPYTQLRKHQDDGPLIITEGQGVYVRDSGGREYLDGMAGLWCVNVGWGRPELIEAIRIQSERLPFFHSFGSMANEPAIELGEKVIELAPEGMARVFFGCTGSDANDTNVKLIWYYNQLRGKPEKRKILSRRRAYHGVTSVAASLSGLESMHAPFGLPLPGFLHTECPHHYREAPEGMSELEFSAHLAGTLREQIEREGPETVAALVAEPLMGAGGVIPPPDGYWEAISAVLEDYDVLLVADEVICGFGRLGSWFGSDTYGLKPDFMTIAKGLSSGYVPISGSIVSERVWKVLLEGQNDGYLAHGFTYSSHPLAAAAALANLDVLEKEDLPANAARVGAVLQGRLAALRDHAFVGEVRGKGLIAAVELVADKANKTPFAPELKVAPRMASLCLEEGLISRALPESNALSFSPPLVLTEEEAHLIVDRFESALVRLEATL